VSELVKQVVEGYGMLDVSHALSFIGGEGLTADVDRALLVEAVRTLIDNAIKYSPSGGGVSVTVSGDGDNVLISVADNGVGIDEDDLPYIFDRFYRCDKTRGREKGSAGLGLTICKNIVEMMKGTISVNSVKGEGTTFTIKI
jgi:signal transduction histidine kinase